MIQLFDNIVWHTLSESHARFATGTNDARRYSRGFSPIIGFADVERPNFAALMVFCEPGERFYCDGWSGPVPSGWQKDFEATMFKMVWDAEMPLDDGSPDGVRLGPEHIPQVLELAALTHPGPFGKRTIELGDYFGIFHAEKLVAMAGERMSAGNLREISGVGTHPDFRGRGLARRLMLKLIRLQLRRDETPVLHVMRSNDIAHSLYERIGFRDYKETVLRVVSMHDHRTTND